MLIPNPFQKNNSVRTLVQQASLCINRGFETGVLNVVFKFEPFYEIGTFESDMWRAEEGSERKGRV